MIFSFSSFTLDTERRELRDGDRPVALTPKAFDVLCYLVEHRVRMVTKAELLDAFWSAQVSEAALQKTMSLIRKALATGGDPSAMLKTHHGLGFRFIAQVDPGAPVREEDDSRPPVTLREQRLIAVLCVRGVDPSLEQANPQAILDPAKRIVERYEGDLLRLTVDGFAVSFGLAHAHEDAARRAAHCALDLKATAENAGQAQLRFGIHTGPGAVLEENEAEQWTPPGETERGATGLAESAEAGDILISADTRDQLRDEVESHEHPAGYCLIRMSAMQAGVPARPRKSPAGFVGRKAELGFLNHMRELMMAGSGQGVTLSGPAGIGKTRLVNEFLAAIDAAGCQSVKLQCLPGLCNSPGAPIVAMCRALFSDAPEGTLRDEVDAALHRELLHDPAEREPILQALSEHQHRQRSYALVNRMLAARAAAKPVVVVIEDSHWIDATSQTYLDAILQEIETKRAMILITTRPTETAALAEGVLHLSPLGQADSFALLRQTTDQVQLSPAAAGLLVQRAGGNPFFIEELALAAQVGGDPSTELPDTVQAVIAVRIGALEPPQRVLVYIIAVIGPPAPLHLIAGLTGRNADEVEVMLDHLIRLGFLRVDADGYAFRHMLIHDTAYAMVAPDERRRLHSDIARRLTSKPHDGTARSETLAWHYQEAGQTETALTYWIAASRDALQRSARHEAIAFARSGLALIDTETPDAGKRELDLQLCLASAAAALSGYGAPEVGEAYRRARSLNSDLRQMKAEVRLLVGLWIHTWVRGQLTEALGYGRKLQRIAEKVHDPALKLQAEASIGQVLVHQGAISEALEHLKAGLGHIKRAPPTTLPSQNAAVACASYAAWATSLGGDKTAARQYIRVSERLSGVLENPFAQAIHYALCSEPCMFLGDVGGCLELAERAVEISRTHDFNFWLGTGLVMRGWAQSQLQEPDAAFAAFEEGIAVFEATGARVQLANWYGLKAEAHLAAGQLQAGLDAGQHALICAQTAEDVFFVPRIHATLSSLQVRLGSNRAATTHAEQATRQATLFGMADQFVRSSGSVDPIRTG